MPFNEALFWVGLTVGGTGGYFWFDGEKRRWLAVALTVLGLLAVAYSVYVHDHPAAPRPATWVVLLGFTWLAIAYDVYERRSQKVPSSKKITPIRALERHYMALASLREHVGHLVMMDRLSDEPPKDSPYYDVESAVEKMRAELMNLAPSVLPVATVLDFQKASIHKIDVKARVPEAIDALMKSVFRHWLRCTEQAGITPLRFKAAMIVKLEDE